MDQKAVIYYFMCFSFFLTKKKLSYYLWAVIYSSLKNTYPTDILSCYIKIINKPLPLKKSSLKLNKKKPNLKKILVGVQQIW